MRDLPPRRLKVTGAGCFFGTPSEMPRFHFMVLASLGRVP
jgi:hypothetical protein